MEVIRVLKEKDGTFNLLTRDDRTINMKYDADKVIELLVNKVNILIEAQTKILQTIYKGKLKIPLDK